MSCFSSVILFLLGFLLLYPSMDHYSSSYADESLAEKTSLRNKILEIKQIEFNSSFIIPDISSLPNFYDLKNIQIKADTLKNKLYSDILANIDKYYNHFKKTSKELPYETLTFAPTETKLNVYYYEKLWQIAKTGNKEIQFEGLIQGNFSKLAIERAKLRHFILNEIRDAKQNAEINLAKLAQTYKDYHVMINAKQNLTRNTKTQLMICSPSTSSDYSACDGCKSPNESLNAIFELFERSENLQIANKMQKFYQEKRRQLLNVNNTLPEKVTPSNVDQFVLPRIKEEDDVYLNTLEDIISDCKTDENSINSLKTEIKNQLDITSLDTEDLFERKQLILANLEKYGCNSVFLESNNSLDSIFRNLKRIFKLYSFGFESKTIKNFDRANHCIQQIIADHLTKISKVITSDVHTSQMQFSKSLSESIEQKSSIIKQVQEFIEKLDDLYKMNKLSVPNSILNAMQPILASLSLYSLEEKKYLFFRSLSSNLVQSKFLKDAIIGKLQDLNITINDRCYYSISLLKEFEPDLKISCDPTRFDVEMLDTLTQCSGIVPEYENLMLSLSKTMLKACLAQYYFDDTADCTTKCKILSTATRFSMRSKANKMFPDIYKNLRMLIDTISENSRSNSINTEGKNKWTKDCLSQLEQLKHAIGTLPSG